jgi:hypothetical protein
VASGGVQCPLASRCAQRLHAGNSSGARGEALGTVKAGTLDSQGLAHDRTAASQDLEIGHSATSRAAAGTGSSRECAEGGGRSPLEERAHGTRLLQKSLHCDWIEAKRSESRTVTRVPGDFRETQDQSPRARRDHS